MNQPIIINSNAVIINCNKEKSEQLCSEIKINHPLIKITVCYESIAECGNSIGNYYPCLLFIDPDNCGGDGYAFLEMLDKSRLEIVIISNFSQRVSFKSSNLHAWYIDAQYNKTLFMKIINKAMQELERKVMAYNAIHKTVDDKLKAFKEYRDTKIKISSVNEFLFTDVKNIICCESDNVTVTFYLIEKVEGSTKCESGGYYRLVSSNSMKEWQSYLEERGIIRVHREYMVNLEHIEKVTKGISPSVLLKKGIIVTCSKNYKEILYSFLP